MIVQTKEPVLSPSSKVDLKIREGIVLPDSSEVRIRSISPGDEDGLREMLSRLSGKTIYKRFHLPMPRVPERMLAYLTDVDHHDRESLIAQVGKEIVGQAMYARQEANEAEMAIMVEDRWQSRRIGRLLLICLAEMAVSQNIEVFTGTVLGQNRGALRFFSSILPKASFKIRHGVYHLYVPLPDAEPVCNLKPSGAPEEKKPSKTQKMRRDQWKPLPSREHT